MESAIQRGTLFTIGLFFAAGLVVSHGEDYDAICVIQPLGIPGMNISGTIMLHESASTMQTTVIGQLYGFDKNMTDPNRGFHVHTSGNLSDNCNAAGSHYNPSNQTHGGPKDSVRHVGDLGNIIVNNMTFESMINITDTVISLHGNNSIVGRALVVHSGRDDLGQGGNDESKKTGNSGTRIGCCVITLSQPMTIAPPSSTTPMVSSATSMGPLTGIALICLAGLQLFIKSMQ